jgi:acetate---CoA ligase (ADP-forming)
MTALSDHKTHQGGNEHTLRPRVTASPAAGDAVRTMLEASSVALVGASMRAASFGSRMLEEVGKSGARPRIYPVNPRYAELAGARCYPSLADLPEAPELALLAVPDAALEQQLSLAAETGCRSAVIFGNAHDDQAPAGLPRRGMEGDTPAIAGAAAPVGAFGAAAVGTAAATAQASRPGLRERLAVIARDAGMALCGAGCMGFANVSHGLRALGYTEPDPLPAGPVALVTHSGSVFSALLRAKRGFGFTLAVSSGQELVTAAPAYLDYALSVQGTRVLGLVLETIRDGAALREVLGRAAEQDIPVVLLTAGSSAGGRAMVAAHSGALAGSDGGWEALARAYGVHRVTDLAEFTDTLELFSLGRRVPARHYQRDAAAPWAGIATVHDSGLERAHVVDVAEALGVPFAEIEQATRDRLAGLLDPGLVPANPLDVWGTGADTRDLFGACMLALADDPAVDAVALAVDLVHEYDGDDSYPLALLEVAARTTKPLAVVSNLSAAIDPELAQQLRGKGVPVLEGTRSGLLALRHLLDHARRQAVGADLLGPQPHQRGTHDLRRQVRGALLASGQGTGAALLDLLADYGIPVTRSMAASDLDGTLAAAEQVGYPVVLKTDEPAIAHKSDVGGVLLGIRGPAELAAAYQEMTSRLGRRALVCQTVPPGVELALGIVRDPELGPLIVVGAGGVLVELLADRAVALPPVSAAQARDLLAGLRVARLLTGIRGARPADLGAVTRAITGLSDLALELGDHLDALDINPLVCGPEGAVAVDALAIAR